MHRATARSHNIALLLGAAVAATLLLASPVSGQTLPPELRIHAVRDFHLQPRVTTRFLEDAYMTRPDEGWIVGAEGTILQYAGGRLIDRSDPLLSTDTIHHLSFCSPEVGWAVGGAGTILRFHRGRWAREDSGVRHWLQAIACLDDDEAWAMGAGGIILHRRGGSWRVVASPTTRAIKKADFVSRTDGWAVGTGVLLRLVGGAWQPQPLPVPPHVELYGLAMLSPYDGWIVGQYGTILRYDGRAWRPQPSPTDQLLEEVRAVSKREVFACGWSGTVLRAVDVRWWALPSLTNEQLFGCHFPTSHRGLVVGHHGLVWLYDAPHRQFFPTVRR
ncbi:MAG: hypothetical protein HY691_11340 [Chloroflexi bacterium]|nr:hypothetical protein [Chloroflexota bacterium]